MSQLSTTSFMSQSINYEQIAIEKAFKSDNFDVFFDLSLKYFEVNRNNNKTHIFILSTLKKMHRIFKWDFGKYEDQYLEALRNTGILCYSNSYFSLSINFYYLAYIQCGLEQRNEYYYYIALSLMKIGDNKNAKIYYEKALKEAKTNNPEEAYLIISYKLNYIGCLISMDLVSEAKRLFNKIVIPDKLLKAFEINNGIKYVEFLLEIVSNKEQSTLNKAEVFKKELLQQGSYAGVLEINNILLKKGCIAGNYETILLENLECARFINNLNVKKKVITDLVEYYLDEGNVEREYFYLRTLFKLNNDESVEMRGDLIDIYINMKNLFIENLTMKNKLISDQKSELEEITFLLSHDIKTPLRTIISFTGLLNRDLERKDYSCFSDYLSYIKNSSETMYKFTDDLAVLHQVEKLNKKFVKVDLNEIVGRVKINLKHLLKEKNAQIVVAEKLPIIRAIKNYMIILFNNIIENAIKYNQSKMPNIKILAKIKNNKTFICFKDNGIGIEEEYQEQIFSFFKRLHHSLEYNGTGFGLGICKKILQKHNGDIKVSSKVGEGSTFTIILPVE